MCIMNVYGKMHFLFFFFYFETLNGTEMEYSIRIAIGVNILCGIFVRSSDVKTY